MPTRIAASIASIPSAQWNALALDGRPFLRHEFLAALESCGCVGPASGWIPHYLLLEDETGALEAALPMYLKTHSWGEFVFDFSWAKAHHQAGLRYYPKLLSMAPFTPATGPHLLARPTSSAREHREQLARALLEYAHAGNFSSSHLLFVDAADRAALGQQEFLWRKDCQFHWHNRGYASFDAFVATFRAEKRKKALRERRRIVEAGVGFQTLKGEELEDDLWEIVFEFSAATFAARGNEHYLNVEFFKSVSRALPGAVMIKLAQLQGRPIGAAIFLRGADTLYGRYWGAAAEFHSLHFETCYYQGIDYCIEEGLAVFEPGTQGEHKVPRGFEPTVTWSAHWIADARLRRAIANYLEEEQLAVDQYISQVAEHVPFRRDRPPQATERPP